MFGIVRCFREIFWLYLADQLFFTVQNPNLILGLIFSSSGLPQVHRGGGTEGPHHCLAVRQLQEVRRLPEYSKQGALGKKYGLGWTKHFSLLDSLGTPRLDTHRDTTIYKEASDFNRPCLFGTEWVVATDRKRRLCYDCFWNVRDWLSFDYRIYWK